MKLTRRTFLRAAGVSLALPWLDALAPRRAHAADAALPRRMVCINTPLGVHPPFFFPEGRPDEVQAQARRLRDGRSILDTVREQTTKLQGDLGADDRQKLDEYFTSVRELEQRLAQAEEWSKKPKPKVDAKPPQNVMN